MICFCQSWRLRPIPPRHKTSVGPGSSNWPPKARNPAVIFETCSMCNMRVEGTNRAHSKQTNRAWASPKCVAYSTPWSLRLTPCIQANDSLANQALDLAPGTNKDAACHPTSQLRLLCPLPVQRDGTLPNIFADAKAMDTVPRLTEVMNTSRLLHSTRLAKHLLLVHKRRTPQRSRQSSDASVALAPIVSQIGIGMTTSTSPKPH